MNLKKIETETLKEVAKMLMNDFRDGTDFAFQKTIDELEERMTTEEFVAFSEKL
jgi:hypothetical protein